MMLKKCIPLLTACFLLGLLLSFNDEARAGGAGTAADPLVSQAWVEEYVEKSFAPLEKQVADIRTGLKLPTFTDVNHKDWFYVNVISLARAAVIDGFPDKSFRPQGKVTYGQALKLVLLAAGYSAQPAAGGHWAGGYLSLAQAESFISGQVELDAAINRQELCRLTAAALELTARSGSPFSDTSDPAVIALSEAGIVNGYPDGSFRPGNTISRAETAAIIYRVYTR